jgi:hypothetical protein
MKIKPSRFLNEKSGFLGLSVWDLAILGYLLVTLHSFFSSFGLDWAAFAIVSLAAYFLISLRLRFRKRTVRDFANYQLRSRGAL